MANKLSYLFPAAFMANTYAMTGLLIILGLTGNPVMAADVGIVQGATLALFYAFSANARNLILNQASPVSAQSVMMARLFLMLPLAGAAYWLSVGLAGVEPFLAVVLIFRRCVEWLDEVFLSEMEHLDTRKIPKNYLIFQSVFLLFAIGWTLGKMPSPLLGLFLWALLPLLLSARFYWSIVSSSSVASLEISKMLPHLGSTVIIGITVYVFRLLIILIVGKNIAGDFFTAFAIGGVLGSVFANALGPSLVFHQKRNATGKLPSVLLKALYVSLIGGVVLLIVSIFELDILDWSSKTPLFWGAVGFSMIGSVVMVYAQLIRHQLLQSHEENDLFGPDVIMNILIIAAVPFSYYLLGRQALAALYLFSSVLAFVFYLSYQKRELLNNCRSILFQEKIRILIAVMLLLPIFFQVSGGIFRDPSMYFNSGGALRVLPIPLSVIACYGGILLNAEYRRASVSLSYIFFTCLMMVGTSVIVSQGHPIQEQAKFILLIQFILPMFGFVLGQIYELKDKPESASLEKAFLYTLAVIVPLQLLCTWFQGYKFLSPYLYLFSIYQHLQYVPVVFVSAFLISFCRLWQLSECRKILLILPPLMGIYAAASMSMLAILMLLAGLLGFAIYQLKNFYDKLPALLLLIVALSSWSYLQYEKNAISVKFNFLSEEKMYEIAPNAAERLYYWEYYFKNIISSPKTFLIGHVEPPDRTQYPSAHNYYLDFIYNFGFLALAPMLGVLFYLLNMLYKLRREVYASSSLISLSAVVLFLLVIDNSLKVGLRQPYSGIFIFFLWGVLISRLFELHLKSFKK